jgi:ABC-2 type transport system permease protein
MTYLCLIASFSANQAAVIGFSREGKNLFMLKTLPVSAKAMVDSKFYFATAISVMIAVLAGVTSAVMLKERTAAGIIGLPLTIIVGGIGINCMGLRNDMKNPNLNWTNVNELTKNNMRSMKPMLMGVGIGILYMILGIVFAMQDSLKGELLYTIYYAICNVPLAILAYLCYKRLYDDAEQLLERIEG